jgi:hypothetical protein
MEVKNVKCPNCSKRLTLNMQPGIENKKLRCPVCGVSSPFSSYVEVQPKNSAPAARPGEATRIEDLNHTHIVFGPDNGKIQMDTPRVPGRLLEVSGDGRCYQLKEGRNIVGRENSSSPVDVSLPAKHKYVSRQHLIIDVRHTAAGYIHTVMLCKSEVNRTYINTMQLAYGDQVILNDGDLVKLPELSLRFEQSSRKELYDSDVVTGGRS